MRRLVRAFKATPLDGFTMRLEFWDGVRKELNLETFLVGATFKPVREDLRFFRQVTAAGGRIVCPDGAGIVPGALYFDLKPAWMGEQEHV